MIVSYDIMSNITSRKTKIFEVKNEPVDDLEITSTSCESSENKFNLLETTSIGGRKKVNNEPNQGLFTANMYVSQLSLMYTFQ